MARFQLSMLLFLLCSLPVTSAVPKVLFVSPSHAEDPFFQHVEQFTRIAAADLGLELDVLYGEGNRLLQLQQLAARLTQHQPDYIIVQPYSGGAKALMDFLAKYPELKVITFERLLLASEEDGIGIPRQHYHNWIAEIYFDNTKASADMTRALLDHCRDEAKTGRPGVIGLNGAHGFEAEQRGAALQALSRADPDYEFEQLVFSQWQRELAASQSRQLLRRYPQTSIIWAASDWMALGVLDMLREQPKPLERYCIGGFDWLPENIEYIQSGDLVASVGGHFMMGAWAMVAVYDHWHDSLPENILAGQPAFELEVITQSNVESYRRLLDETYWRSFDFRSLTFRHQQQDRYFFQLQQ
ncbi:MAG: ABC transporter substrate-binding protein [Alkalimonas sp.]|nr:ABC transporter substrate-binding protein [Alkalimonas sp.]